MRYLSVFILFIFIYGFVAGQEVLPHHKLSHYVYKIHLKPNQILTQWNNNPDRFDITTFLDDGLINDSTIDSLAGDSRIQLDSIIEKINTDCDFIGFRYANKTSGYCSEIWVLYYLENGKIRKIDSLGSRKYSQSHYFPLLPNQFFDCAGMTTETTHWLDLALCNIVPNSKINLHSLEQDNKKQLVELLKKLPKRWEWGEITSVHIRYINQYGKQILKDYCYPLSAPYSPKYYLNMYRINTESK